METQTESQNGHYKRPKQIYKYCGNDHLIENLREGVLWFSPSDELNDLFEGKYRLSPTLYEELVKKHTDAMWPSKMDFYLNLKNEHEFYEMLLPHFKSPEMMNVLYNHFFRGRDKGLAFSVCSFSTTHKSELMWGHYAEKNSGVCLGFDLTKAPEWEKGLFKVEYTNELYELDSLRSLFKANLRKRKVWKYEKEWRLLSRDYGLHEFDKRSLKKVIFGCNVTENREEEIKNVIKESGYKNVKFERFQLKIDDVIYTQLDFPFEVKRKFTFRQGQY